MFFIHAHRPRHGSRVPAIAMSVAWGLALISGAAPAGAASSLSTSPSPEPAAASTTPQILTSFPGYSEPVTSPPDTTLAASPTQVMELVNDNYLITDRTGKGTSGTLEALVGTSNVFLSDPQVIWDPATSRFYFSVFENRGRTKPNEGLAWGFSKTANPASASDFCTYFARFNYGATSFPDRDSLGDSSDFLLIASNRFSTENESWLGSDLAWITKPPPGSSCPEASSFKKGIKKLSNPDGTAPWTPVPSRQVDSDGTGWVLATPRYSASAALTLVQVTATATGKAKLAPPVSVAVPEYGAPPSAPQAGHDLEGKPAHPIETRIYLTQVVMAYDPRIGHTALWTDHTIAGGAGAEVRWYEINPVSVSVDQLATVADPKLYVFNGTVSPDRLVNGSTSAFGSNAVINVNTSSATTYPAIQMAGSTNGQAQSGLVLVKQSPGPNIESTCAQPSYGEVCRWGDYSGAAPDPGASPTAVAGNVWLANQWNVAQEANPAGPPWRTTIWRASP